MKILQINKFSHLQGGSETYLYNVIDLLRRKDHTTFLFTMDKPDHIRPKLFWNFTANSRLDKFIKDFKPDVAHLHNIYHHFSPSILYTLKKHKIPIVMTLHDYKIICPNYRLYNKEGICEKCKPHKYYQCFKNDCFNDWARSAGATLETYMHNSILGSYERHVDCFISPSTFLKKKLEDWGVENKIEFIPNFSDVKKEENQKDIKEQDYYLYFGRLSEEKGIRFLIEVFKKLNNKKLVIIGDGPLKNYVLKNRSENIEYLGFKTGEDLKQHILEAKAIIYPSLWYENAPIALIEAILLDKPVIVANTGGMPEIAQNGAKYALFKPGNQLELANIIKNNTFKAGQNQKNLYNKEFHYTELLKVYNSVNNK